MSTKVSVSMNREYNTPETESVTVGCVLIFDDEQSQSLDADTTESHLGCIIAACRRIVVEELMKERKAQSRIDSKH